MKTAENAVWLYLSGDARTPQEIDRFAEWCRANRVGHVLVHLSLLPNPGEELKQKIASIVAACADAGIEVHGMIGTLLQRTTDRRELLFDDPSCYCVDAHGISNWEEPICGRGYVFDPANPDVVRGVAAAGARLLDDFPGLAGIHLDFIRYYHYESRLTIDTKHAGHWILMPKPGHPIRFEMADGSKVTYFVERVQNAYNDPPVGDRLTLARQYRFCFCDGCLRRFQERSGIDIPEHLTRTAEKAEWILRHHAAAWAEYRAEAVTGVVRAIREAIRSKRPDAKLSAAVWYNAPYGNELRGEPLTPDSEYDCFGQKWSDWARDGLIDFVCPMDYWLSPENFGNVVRDQIAKAGEAVPVYAGVLRSGEYPLTGDQLAEYAERASAAGASGICFFHYGTWKDVLP